MEIYGYSERGVMNALFYGIALCNNGKDADKHMNEFLKLSGIHEQFTNFKLYVEFSLSEFGDPDLVFTAINSKKEKTVFFVEAKVSAGSEYKLAVQKNHHEEYMSNNEKYKNGHSSNLFFQLKEKYLLLEHGPNNLEKKQILDRVRKLGDNKIVNKFYDDITDGHKNEYYIAIVPEQKDIVNPIRVNIEQTSFEIYLVFWERIKENNILKDFILPTIKYNSYNDKSQITNNIK